jgi:hypothetical protein
MPTLALTNVCAPPTMNGSATLSRSRSAISIARSREVAVVRSSQRIVNSSPPKRATVSPGRSTDSSRRATDIRSSSPAS